MLGPFATASRRTPPFLHWHSAGVTTVARRLRIDVHNNDDNDNNDNAWQRGPLWPQAQQVTLARRRGVRVSLVASRIFRVFVFYWLSRGRVPSAISCLEFILLRNDLLRAQWAVKRWSFTDAVLCMTFSPSIRDAQSQNMPYRYLRLIPQCPRYTVYFVHEILFTRVRQFLLVRNKEDGGVARVD